MKVALLKSLQVIRDKPAYLVYSFCMELCFIIVGYGFLVQPFINHALEFVAIIGERISEKAATLSTGTAITDLLFLPEIKPLTINTLLLFLIAFLILFFVFCFFEGLAWYFAHKTVQQIRLLNFLKKFSLVSLPWYLVYIILTITSLFLLMRASLGTSITPDQVSQPFTLFLLLMLGYLVIVSYAIIPQTPSLKENLKKTFSAAKQPKVFFSFVTMLIMLYALNWILVGAQMLGETVFFSVGIPLLFVFLFFMKIFFIQLLNHGTQEQH